MAREIPDDFSFPFEPYAIQQDFMRNLYRVLQQGKIGIFESPTGTGKSLSLLCSSLKFVRDHEEALEKEILAEIESLKSEILSSLDKKDDWIEEQYLMIQKKQRLLEIEDKFASIAKYGQKIKDIKSKILEKETRVTKKVLDENGSKDSLLIDENGEQEDFLLAEIETDSEDEQLDDDEKAPFKPLQVFFCSRTHSQLSQLVGEVKSTTHSKDLRSVSLGSRQNYCINKSVKQLRSNVMINERCLELQKSKPKDNKKDEDHRVTKSRKLVEKSCPFYKKNLEKLRNLSLNKVMDIEELAKVGAEEKSCPYYSSRAAVTDSQLIFVPYQILFNKATREQCGINLKDNVVIIDEAHNLMDTISQIHTATVTLDQLKTCHRQLLDYKMRYAKRFASKNLLKFNQFIFITKQFIKFLEAKTEPFRAFEPHEVLSDTSIYNICLFDILKFCDQTRFAQKVHGYSKIHQRLVNEEETAEAAKKNATKNFLLELQEQSKKKKSKIDQEEVDNQENPDACDERLVNVMRIVIQFIDCLTQRYEGGRILVSHDEVTKETAMKFLLLDPSSPFEDIISDCRSIILAGGTMKPTEELTEQLFKKVKDRVEIHSFGHVVASQSILPIALSHGTSGKEFMFTHANKNCSAMINEVSITIRNVCTVVPGGIVCFFTSYDNLNRIYSHMKEKQIIEMIEQRKEVFVEPRKSSETEKVLENYSKAIKLSNKKGAIIFSVIGGKLSEGMNFADDLGRCVIVVGLPFPNKTSPELVEKMNFLSKNLSQSAASEYYENLCMRAVNQSIGRAIRHIGDYAAVLLLDSRYHRPNILKKLPDWIKSNLTTATAYGKVHSEIAKFFREHRS